MSRVLLKIVMTLFALSPFIVSITLCLVFRSMLFSFISCAFLFTNAIHITVLDKYGID